MKRFTLARQTFRILVFLGIIQTLWSCEKMLTTSQDKDPEVSFDWISYTILPNTHRSLNNAIAPFKDSIMHFNVVFDSSCVYKSLVPINQLDWNKVAGFSDCNSFHQTNSLRLGWRYTPNTGIELAAYQYTNGNRSFTIVDTVQLLDTVEVELKRTSSYQTVLNNLTINTSRSCMGAPAAYRLYPYFGGDEVAQDTMRIHIQWLDSI